MSYTRRQFGLWSTAALLLPATAAASEPMPQAVQAPDAEPGKADALASLVVVAEPLSTTEHGRTYTLWAEHGGKNGMAVEPSVEDPLPLKGVGDGSLDQAVVYLNGDHPLARRLVLPSMVDLPSGQRTALAVLHVDGSPQATLGLTHVALRVRQERDARVLSVALPARPEG